MFTSAKARESKNLDTLYKYLNHRLYDYNFATKPQIVERDLLFIPTGFDSKTLIAELCSGNSMLTTGSDGQPLSYEEVLRPAFMAMNNNKARFGKANHNQPAEVFLESEDWQQLLQQKFKAQEAQVSTTE